MTHDELETKVYDKMSAEYDELIDGLKQMMSQDIIDNAYQIVMKQDILFSMENHFLNQTQLQMLLELENPLDDLYQNWLLGDCPYMDALEESTQDYLNNRLKTQAEEKYCKPDSPIYLKGIRQAGDDGELHEWKASNEQNIQCRLHFVDAAERAYNIGELPAFVQTWVEKYGLDRCLYVASFTVQKKDYDHRFDAAIRKRASAIEFADGGKDSCISHYAMSIDTGAVNAAMSELMKLEKERGNTYTIYQLKSGDDLHYIRFEPLARLHEEDSVVSASNYRRVYTAPLDSSTTLERIYERFNINNPPDFYGHSLSVSDVVVLRRDGKESAFYCDSIGFTELPDFKSAKAEQDLPQKLKRRESIER